MASPYISLTTSGLGSLFGGTSAATATTTAWVSLTNGTVTTTSAATIPRYHDGPNIVIRDGTERNIHLPDGTFILVAKDGSFTINDKDAKVTYRANRVRNFNAFVNASDKLEAFIAFCGAAGVRQGEMLDIPIKHFIAWLIVEAAKADGEAEPATEMPMLPAPRATRCRCGRFMPRKLVERKIAFCRPVCLERELAA